MGRVCVLTSVYRCVWAMVLVACAAGVARAAEEKLPSAVKSRVTRINSMLDQANKALEADRLTTAQRKIKDARKVMKEIQDRYAGKFSPEDPDYKAMAERLEATAKKVEDAAAAASASAEQAAKAKAENEALCKAWVDKLDPFVNYKSDLYLRMGAELNNASAEDQAKSKQAYVKAKALMEEYQQVKFPLGKTQELKNVESRLTGTMKYYGEAEASQKQEQACAEWVARLRPFADVGAGSDKLLIASPTVNAEQIKAQKAIYEEAKAAFEEYRKAEFPLGKTWRLEQLEAELQKRLEEFPQAMAESMAMMSGDIGKRLDAVLEYLQKDKAWQSDKSKKPPIIMERDLKPLQEEVQRMAGTGAADEAKLAELKGKLKAIGDKDAEHRRIRSERTYQAPDGFKGSELAALKAKAVEVVKAEYKDVKVLRTTVPSKEWAIEDVIEATDTTRTALRHRITRSVRAQLAIKRDDGKVYLQEVYLGQDKQGEGWGSPKGHTTWSDWMREENVGKDGP